MSAPPAGSTSSSSELSSSTSGATTLRADSIGTVGVTATVVSAAAPLTVMAGVAPIALAITRECSTPRRFLPYFERAATGSRGY
jgi:hypothetical protein